MRKRRPPLTPVSEEILHRHVAQFLDVVIKPPMIWTTIPAGGGGLIRGAKLKAMGLKKGWPDILIIAPGPVVLGIELKRADGKQSDEQRAVEVGLLGCGAQYVVCRSVEEVQRAVHFVQRRRVALPDVGGMPYV
jgi:hypothetical protein